MGAGGDGAALGEGEGVGRGRDLHCEELVRLLMANQLHLPWRGVAAGGFRVRRGVILSDAREARGGCVRCRACVQAPAPACLRRLAAGSVEGPMTSRVITHLSIGTLAEILDDLVVVNELAVFGFHDGDGGGVDKIPRNIIGSRS